MDQEEAQVSTVTCDDYPSSVNLNKSFVIGIFSVLWMHGQLEPDEDFAVKKSVNFCVHMQLYMYCKDTLTKTIPMCNFRSTVHH